MADFGTILNPDNTALDLYCRSITTTQAPPVPFTPSQFYGYNTGQAFTSNTPQTMVMQQPTLVQNISGGAGRYTNMTPGMYLFSSVVQIVVTAGGGASTSLQVYKNGILYPLNAGIVVGCPIQVLTALPLQSLVRIDSPADVITFNFNCGGGNGNYSGFVCITYAGP